MIKPTSDLLLEQVESAYKHNGARDSRLWYLAVRVLIAILKELERR